MSIGTASLGITAMVAIVAGAFYFGTTYQKPLVCPTAVFNINAVHSALTPTIKLALADVSTEVSGTIYLLDRMPIRKSIMKFFRSKKEPSVTAHVMAKYAIGFDLENNKKWKLEVIGNSANFDAPPLQFISCPSAISTTFRAETADNVIFIREEKEVPELLKASSAIALAAGIKILSNDNKTRQDIKFIAETKAKELISNIIKSAGKDIPPQAITISYSQGEYIKYENYEFSQDGKGNPMNPPLSLMNSMHCS